MTRFKLDKKCLAYAMTALGASMMNSVFYFYYVKVFIDRFKVPESWFQISQVVFMVWNTINDPLFGYIQDNMNCFWVKSRRHSILFGAPFYALSFAIPWFAWGSYETEGGWLAGVQLMFSLCFFDTTFTFVLLAECALFAELSQKHDDRVMLVRYSQVASLLGSLTVFLCEYISHNLDNYFNFQITCVVIAMIALLCMRYTGVHSTTDFDGIKETANEPGNPDSKTSIFRQTFQIFTHRSFISFILMNFCQIYHSSWLSNFAKIIFDHIYAEQHLSSFSRSVYYGMMNFLPQVVVIVGSFVIPKIGYFRLLRASFALTVALGLFMLCFQSSYIPLVIFFMFDSVLCRSTFSLFNICLSDIIDADVIKYSRRYPLSSMVFGINALVTKPAVSLAPMVTVAYLNQHGYETLNQLSNNGTTSTTTEDLSHAMYNTVVYTPLFIGTIQTVVWCFYTIRDSHRVEASVSDPGFIPPPIDNDNELVKVQLGEVGCAQENSRSSTGCCDAVDSGSQSPCDVFNSVNGQTEASATPDAKDNNDPQKREGGVIA